MIPNARIALRLVPALLCAGLLASASAAHAGPALITEEEARLPDATAPGSTRGISRGPGIRLSSPEEVRARGFPLRLSFEPRGGARIDPASLRVSYLKTPAVDLTSRVKPGLNGNEIELAQVSVPPGRHPIRVSVRDTEGREGTATFQLHAR